MGAMKWHPFFKTYSPIMLKFQFWNTENERTNTGRVRNFTGPLPETRMRILPSLIYLNITVDSLYSKMKPLACRVRLGGLG